MKTYRFAPLLIALFISAANSRAAAIAWTNASGGNWSSAGNWSPNQIPGSSDDVLITLNGTYAVTLDVSATIASLTLGGASGQQTLANPGSPLTLNSASIVNTNGILGLSGGTLSGSGLLTVRGLFNWTSGTIGGSAVVTIATNGVLVLAGNNGNSYDLSGVLTNAGTVRLDSGNLQLKGSCAGTPGQLINLPGALVDIPSDVSIGGLCGTELFINQGTVRKSGGTGTTTIAPTFNNTGTLDGQTGTVSLNGGGNGNGQFIAEAGATILLATSYTVSAGSQFSGAGTNRWTGGTITVNGTVTAQNLELAGATLSGTPTFIGTVNWTGGTIGGSAVVTIATNGVLVLAGNNGNSYDLSGVLTNAGTVRLASGNLQLKGSCAGTPGQLINLSGALVDIRSDVSIVSYCSVELFINQGTVRKSGGTGTTTIAPTFNNTGTLDGQTGTVSLNGGGSGNGQFIAEAGATILFPNSYTVSAGSQFSGAGTNRWTGGTITVNGTVTAQNLELAGATLSGTPTFTGTVNWISGTIGGSVVVTIATNGVLVLAGNNGNSYDLSGVLTNAGTVRLASGNLQLKGSCAGTPGQLINLPGALVDIQSDVSIVSYCSVELFINQGTVRKSGGTGTTTISTTFNNTGTLDGQTGTVNLNGGVNGNGQFIAEAGATILLATSYTASAGSQFSGAGTNRWTGGTITVNGTVTAQNLELAGATLSGTPTFIGTVNWISGTIGGSAVVTIATNGVLVLAGNNGNSYDLSGVLTNAGTVRLASGNLQLKGSCAGTPGQLVNLPGALVDIPSDVSIGRFCGTELFINQGTVRKSGGTGFSYISPTFNNTGTLDIRSGIVSLNGGYAPGATSVHRFAVGGYAAGTGFGRLQVSGSLTLAGQLGLMTTNSFFPTNGASFAVITASSRSGTFASVTGRSIGGGLYFNPTYPATGVTLVVADGKPSFKAGSLSMTNGQFQFQLQGIASETYRIDASTNLTAWTAISTNVIPGSAFLDFTDTDSTNYLRRFYRAVFLP